LKDYKVLNIKGALLDKAQLENYLEKIASDHVLQIKSSKETYPIPRLKENYEVITQIYELLTEHIKLKIPIHPAGEWILDNYYIIEETVKSIIKDINIKKYTNFPGIANGPYAGFARIYELAGEIVAYTDCKISSKTLPELLKAYQSKKNLNMEEIWNIGPFLQIALIEKIREVCEKIYSAQLQKYKVENIIERLVEEKERDKCKFKNVHEYRMKIIGYEELKYPFIEYMSYRLKKLGRKAYPFLEVLEDEVNKMGLDISEVIKKEHFDIAVRKVTVGNSITSIKAINRMNFVNIFEEINGVEEILKKDPTETYAKMDYKTRIYYRNAIKKMAKKTRISEIYIAQKALELATKEFNKSNKDVLSLKKSHIGYYFIDDGKDKLMQEISNKKVETLSTNNKSKLYVYGIMLVSTIISIFMAWCLEKSINNVAISIITAILLFVPIQVLVQQIVQYILGKFVSPKIIPKLDFSKGIPEEYATFVVIPTILNNVEKVEELAKKLEVYYLANKTDNLYFTILGDCKPSNQKVEEIDEKIVREGIKRVEKLNEKYNDNKFPKFHFLYRERIWNEGEACYLGWERKRGLLNQFNEFIQKGEIGNFKANTIEQAKQNKKIPFIKYVITLDADTNLVLNSGIELVGAMAHVLNLPILNKNGTAVEGGHALIQPRVGIDLLISNKTWFTKIYAGSGGTDPYSNAVSDTYHDNFNEGIFTGKGIYDLEVFYEIFKNTIPENTVLSHDLLEGNYLRCGLATDIELMDGYPTTYQTYKTRQSRWIRGDWQIIKWLGKKVVDRHNEKRDNPLNLLSKYKILDNLFRSLLEISSVLLLFMAVIIWLWKRVNITPILITVVASIVIATIIDIVNKIIFYKEGEKKQKTFSKNVGNFKASLLRGIFSLALLPDRAYMSLTAITKTLYRMYRSKKNLLEWTTAEEAELNQKSSLQFYYTSMISNVLLAIIVLFSMLIVKNIFINIFLGVLVILWVIAPFVMWYISKNIVTDLQIEKIDQKDKEYIIDVAKRTWNYFKENLNEKSNFLPPDNFQEDRIPKIVYRTSPTNIGLALLAVISSYDLKFEKLDTTLSLIEKMINTIYELPKWNGHLYNWYDINKLVPLEPKYVSSVDSGNLIGYLYVVREFLEEVENNTQNIDNVINQINNIINNTDFSKLYNEENMLFSIGFNVEENSLTDSYYDLLASEARQTSLIAIAKKDVDVKHWSNLSRTLTKFKNYKGLLSWSGTAFEYLMPNINIPKYPGSLLDESCKFMIMSQQEYAKLLNIPWGFSEAAFNLKDLNNNYQYKAFGIPWLGLKRGLSEEIVVAPYGSAMALYDEPKEVINNLKLLQKNNMYNKYGFYEAIDYTSTRLRKNEEFADVKTYMAHHQGLILLSINNLINNNILPKRFMENPEMKAVDILLQERMPESLIVTKEKKEKVEKVVNIDYETYTQREISKINDKLKQINVISNNNYAIVMDEKGNGYSKYKNILINRYKKTDDIEQGIYFFFKNIRTKRIWTTAYMSYLNKPDKYTIYFAPDSDKIVRQDGNIETILNTTISPNEPVEIRKVKLTNTGLTEEIIEVTSMLEPMLSTREQDYAHKVFNNLFLSYEWLEKPEILLVKRKAREENGKDVYLAMNLYTENETIGEIEFETDKEKFLGRNNLGLPKEVENSTPFSKKIGTSTETVSAMKRMVNILPNQSVEFNLIVAVGETREEALGRGLEFKNEEKIKRSFNLARAKVEAENNYLGIKGKDVELYQKILRYLVFNNPLKTILYKGRNNEHALIEDLWKYGISGDIPILLVKIKDANDIEIVKEIIKAYDYFRIKNIEVDLVIINEEKNSYNNYVKEGVQNAILNQGLGFMQNIKGGIFLLNGLNKKDKESIEYRANLVINAGMGSILRQIKDLEEEYVESIKEVGDENNLVRIQETENYANNIVTEDLKYNNEYGGFSEDGTEYKIKVSKNEKLPTVWSHVLANKTFGSVVTESMGGYTWFKNSRLNRLTAWNNNPVTDVPSEVIYLEDMDSKKVWSMGLSPVPDDLPYYITYGLGYAKYSHISDGIKQSLDVFIPMNESAKIQVLTLENTQLKKKEIKIVYYLKPVLDEDEIKSNGYKKLEYNNKFNMVCMQNIAKPVNSNIMWVSSNENILSYTGSKQSFFGKGNLQSPDGLRKVELDNMDSLWQDGIIAIEMKVEIEALSKKKIVLILGAGESMLECQDAAYKYSNLNNVRTEFMNTKKYWSNMVNHLQVKTPMESMDIMLNNWLLYQTICSRIWARSGYYQSGGAFGFRDQLQDAMATKYTDIDILKNQIIKHSEHQFLEGDVEHWWHEETGRGIRTRFSDDLLWLVYVVLDYVYFTGDKGILEIETPYLQGPPLEEGVDERYDKYSKSDVVEDIYGHCIRAIERSLNFGKHGLPKIGSGDWNDGFNKVGNKGEGESVWLGFFMYIILMKFLPICRYREDEERAKRYEDIAEKLKKALNTSAWDGRWYKRAFMDNGETLGSIENEECKIDSISQSWAVISKAGDNDKKYIALESLENHLVDKENGIIKLLDPPFNKGPLDPGYIKSYLPGVRENGGQYTHEYCC
jgi:cyclic beta-1,2-glucan synthetase